MANTGRGGRQCRGKGEEAMCLGTTGRIVRVAANGKKRTVARGMISNGRPGRPVRRGPPRRLGGPRRLRLRRDRIEHPQRRQVLPAAGERARSAACSRASGGAFSAIARVDKLEHKRNLDNIKGDKNSNPYAVLALAANHQIVVDAGANAVLEVKDGKVSLLAAHTEPQERQAAGRAELDRARA